MSIDELCLRESRRKDAFNQMQRTNGSTAVVDSIFIKDGKLIITLFDQTDRFLEKSNPKKGIEITNGKITINKNDYAHDWSRRVSIRVHRGYQKHEITISSNISDHVTLTFSPEMDEKYKTMLADY